MTLRHVVPCLGFAGALLSISAARAQLSDTQSATAVITAVPKHGEAVAKVPESAIEVKVDGRKVEPLSWQAYGNGPVQMVLLLDNSARTSFGRNLGDLRNFIQKLPPNVAVAVAYMQNGRSVFDAPFSSNHEEAAKSLHLPGGSPGSNGSPYFCLEDLAKHWPEPRGDSRREVLMITDGVDRYSLRFDPNNPYIRAAIHSSQRAGLVVSSIFYKNQGGLSGSFYANSSGQNYLLQVADATGGQSFYQGTINPVSLTPFLSEFERGLENQYELSVPVKPEKHVEYTSLKVKTQVGSVKLRVPNQIAVQPRSVSAN